MSDQMGSDDMDSDETGQLDTIDQVIRRAYRSADPEAVAWTAAGAGEGVTTARNVAALNRLGLVGRIGRDVRSIDLRSRVVGIDLALPVFLAPVGALGLFDPDDALSAGRAAAAAGTTLMCATLTKARWGDVAETAPGRHIFQLYVLGDRRWQAHILDEVAGSGFAAMCVTMDVPRVPRRDAAIDAGSQWATPSSGTVNLSEGWDATHRTAYTWSDLAWLCERSSLPVIVKGVMSSSDARLAVDCGASAVYVSNHGGRVVDHSISSIEALPEVVDAVGSEVEVIVDSGFTRGAEVCKALALGAVAVGIGRLQCWGLAAGGAEGLIRVLELLREEIFSTMSNSGVTSIAGFSPEHVRWTFEAMPDRASPIDARRRQT